MTVRQYRIIFRTPQTPQRQLKPIEDATLYNVPEVRTAIDFVQTNDAIRMVGVVAGDQFYSVVVIYENELLDGHFELK